MKWSVGDKIMAKWPGSSLYYHAEIQSINNDEAGVLFHEGTEMSVPVKDIKSESAFAPKKRSKSPARSRRRSRSRSPGRSPSRKPAALQKPGDSPKRRRSSSRGKKAKNATSLVISEEKKVFIVASGDVTKLETNVFSLRGAKPTVDMEVKPVMDEQSNITRKRKANTFLSSEKKSEMSNYIDAKPSVQKEFGGTVGTFLTYLSSSAFTLLLLLISSNADWSVSKFKLSMIPCSLKDYFDLRVFACYFLFLLFHAFLYALPLGHIMKGSPLAGGKRLNYKISAKYALLVSVAIHFALHHYKIRISFIHDFIFQLAVSATLMTWLINFSCYVISFSLPKTELNPAADTGSHIYDSFMGRILNPRIGEFFDLKMYLYRPAMLGWILLILVEIEREHLSSGKFSFQFLFLVTSQLVYIFMELFYDEEQCPFMFDIKNEGLGFVPLIGELVYVPFFYSLPIRYVISNPSPLTLPHLAIASALFVVGMLLVSISGSQKAAFRKDPYSSSCKSVPAFRDDGERLLVSGLWGKLRHPNYLGEILIGFSWALACGFTHVITWIYPFYLIGLLVHRSMRLDKHSARKHGLSWKVYGDRVKYRIFPGIF